MSSWIRSQLHRAFASRPPVAVILDVDRLLDDEDLAHVIEDAVVVRVHDWVELRKVWDLQVRTRCSDQRLVVVVASDRFRRPDELPFDVEHEADVITRVRWSGPDELRDLFRADVARRDRLAHAARTEHDPAAIVATAYGFRPGNPSDELGVVAELRLDPSTPSVAWQMLARVFQTRIARQVAHDGGDLTALQDAWNDWLRQGVDYPDAPVLREATAALVALLSEGLLRPAPAVAEELPSWVSIGATTPDPDAVLGELLDAEPPTPRDAQGWFDTAAWWGNVRAVLATAPIPPHATDRAWEAWDRLNDGFVTWLLSGYGTTLLSASPTPRGVHQIAPFLARRVGDGASIALVVIDGLAFAQWHQIRTTMSLELVNATGCFAMVPTLTSISRQAIFAGALPIDFIDTIHTTSAEPRRWAAFWADHGLPTHEIAYVKTVGRDPTDVPTLAGRVVAVVVNAVDEIIHGAEVLGDRQVASAIDVWVRAGFLAHFVEHATARGYEVWITADHGNLPSVAGRVPREGQTVEVAGTRVRTYPNDVLRHAVASFGIIWDPPGYPRDAQRPLFAAGRFGFHSSKIRMSHGGLSIDEVIVPFVQVTR